jgi:hypothetical protein
MRTRPVSILETDAIACDGRGGSAPEARQRCIFGVFRIEALPLPFPFVAGTKHFSSESQ